MKIWKYCCGFVGLSVIIAVILYSYFQNTKSTVIISLAITIFFTYQIYSNQKKLIHTNYLLNQFSIYTSQVAMHMNLNNVADSLNIVVWQIEEPIKSDLKKIIETIEKKVRLSSSFEDFNNKYNNKILLEFNKALVIFAENRDSQANINLHKISRELNELGLEKEKLYNYKKSWRKNYYTILLLSVGIPILVKIIEPNLYASFIDSWGLLSMVIFVLANILISIKVEDLFVDGNVGDKIKNNKYGITSVKRLRVNKRREIRKYFPGFLKDVLLLIRTNNLHIAFLKETEYAPEPIRNVLEELIEEMDRDKTRKPFEKFAGKVGTDEALLAMRMLYTFNEHSLNRTHLKSLELLVDKLYQNEIQEFIKKKKKKLWFYSNLTILIMLFIIFNFAIFMFWDAIIYITSPRWPPLL